MDRVTVNIATRKGREKSLIQAVESLLGQADVINIYFNYDPEKKIQLSDEVNAVYAPIGDLGARGKFYFARHEEGYYLTCDDDIKYPKGYVRHLIERIDYYDRRAIVGLHATKFQPKRRLKSYWNEKQLIRYFFDQVNRDEYTTMLGTGTQGHHLNTIRVKDSDLKYDFCVDPQFMQLTDSRELPHITVCRPHAWAIQIPGSQDSDSIWIKHKKDDSIQTRILNMAKRGNYSLIRPDIKLSAQMP